MTKRRLLRWSLILAILAAFAVWLEPTRVVWGWLRGEAFYQGRPTSYWRQEFQDWRVYAVTLEKRGPDGTYQPYAVMVVSRIVHPPQGWFGWFCASILQQDLGRPRTETIDLIEARPMIAELEHDARVEIRDKARKIGNSMKHGRAWSAYE